LLYINWSNTGFVLSFMRRRSIFWNRRRVLLLKQGRGAPLSFYRGSIPAPSIEGVKKHTDNNQ